MSKLEKADILELTVRHLHKMAQVTQQLLYVCSFVCHIITIR